jgi:hypothetical protein
MESAPPAAAPKPRAGVADQIGPGVARRQHARGGDGANAHALRFRRTAEGFRHARPDPTRRAQFGDGQMHVSIGGEAEFQRIGRLIRRQTMIDEGAHIAGAAAAGESQLLRRRAAGFMGGVGGDGNDLDVGRMIGAPGGGFRRALEAFRQVFRAAAGQGFLTDGRQAEPAFQRAQIQSLIAHISQRQSRILRRHA